MTDAVTNDVRLKLDDDVVVTDEMVEAGVKGASEAMADHEGMPLNDYVKAILHSALAAQPPEVVDMDDPKADEATHLHIGDDVDAMRWGQIRDELAKNQEYRERIAELKSSYAELHGDWEHAINRCCQASEDREQALAREKQLREVAKGVAAILEDRAVKQGLHGDLAQAFMALKDVLSLTPAEALTPLCQDIEEGESAIIAQQMRDIAALKDKLSKRDGEVMAAHSILKDIIGWAQSSCPCTDEKPDPCTVCREPAGGVCKAVEHVFPGFILDQMNRALTSTSQAAQSIEERIREDEREKCAKVAEAAHGGPVGAGDGNTYIAGSNLDAATAIRNQGEG